jgi:hypothetical protein
MREHMSAYPRWVPASPFADQQILSLCYKACCFAKDRSRIFRKPVPGTPLSITKGKRTESHTEDMRLRAARIHANLVYDLTKVWLPAVKHI